VVLYDINCAGCHNIKKGSRLLVPDFTPEQLKGYELRVSNAQHEENMPDEKVTAEELSLISTFLIYKKKNK
jgi:mono/diheme cytochrome c family protein